MADARSASDALDQLAALSLQDLSNGAAEPADDWNAGDDGWDASEAVPQFRHASAAPAAAAADSAAASTPAALPRERASDRAGDGDNDSTPAQQATPLREIAFEGGHILEFHGLSETTTSTDLEAWLEKVDRGRLPALIRWVDEEHALALFSDPDTARHALQQPCKYSKRLFSKASHGAKCMAAKQLAPPAPRPKTSTAVASRLISSALGIRGVRDKAAEADLAAQRKQNSEQRRQKQAQQAAAWDDA